MTSYSEHQRQAKSIACRCAVITLSDTRTKETDTSGEVIRRLLTEGGYAVAAYMLVPDDAAQFDELLEKLLSRDEIDAILTNGGTGISRRDSTVEVIERRMEVPLPGFGELFRMLSWEQVKSGAMLSRAVAGIARKKLIFAMPGSTKAVELAMTQLILPELGHLLHELRK